MKVEYIERGPSSPHNSASQVDIVYNGIIYGTWDEESNLNCPEDLTLSRDLKYLVEIGIKIGRQMEYDSKNQ